MDFPAWAKTVPEVLAHLQVTPDNGLTHAEVENRRARHGYNELEKQAQTPLWKLVLSQFDDMLVKVRCVDEENALPGKRTLRLGLALCRRCFICAGLLRRGVSRRGRACLHRALCDIAHPHT